MIGIVFEESDMGMSITLVAVPLGLLGTTVKLRNELPNISSEILGGGIKRPLDVT